MLKPINNIHFKNEKNYKIIYLCSLDPINDIDFITIANFPPCTFVCLSAVTCAT